MADVVHTTGAGLLDTLSTVLGSYADRLLAYDCTDENAYADISEALGTGWEVERIVDTYYCKRTGDWGVAGFLDRAITPEYSDMFKSLMHNDAFAIDPSKCHVHDPVLVQINASGEDRDGPWLQCGVKVATTAPADAFSSGQVSISFSALKFRHLGCKVTHQEVGKFPERVQISICPTGLTSIPEVKPLPQAAFTKLTNTSTTALALNAAVLTLPNATGMLGATATNTSAQACEQQVPAWTLFAEGGSGASAMWCWQLESWGSGARYHRSSPCEWGPGALPGFSFNPAAIAVPVNELSATWVLPPSLLGQHLEWEVSVSLEFRQVKCQGLQLLGTSLDLFTIRSSCISGCGVFGSITTPLPSVKSPPVVSETS